MFSAVSKHTPREGKIDKFFNKNIVENTLNYNFLLNLKSLYTIFEKRLVRNSQFSHHISCSVKFRGSE